MLPAAVDSGRMASKRGVVRLVSLSCFRGSALRRAAAEAAATAAGVPGNHSSSSRSSSSTILMQLGDLPTPELGCTTENMSCRKIVAWAGAAPKMPNSELALSADRIGSRVRSKKSSI